jgi:hypothetical protein
MTPRQCVRYVALRVALTSLLRPGFGKGLTSCAILRESLLSTKLDPIPQLTIYILPAFLLVSELAPNLKSTSSRLLENTFRHLENLPPTLSPITYHTMPLFGSSRREPSPPPVTTAPARKPSLFHRSAPETTATTTTTSSHHASTSRSSGIFGSKTSSDPSIAAATQSLRQAEAAERDADRALLIAKNKVREAREHVARLEREAAEEYVSYISRITALLGNILMRA